MIHNVLNGQTDQFGILVDRYQQMVATLIMNMVHQKDIAEDIGQEVFIRLYKSLDKFKGKSKLSTYIGRIAINLSLNEIKRQKRKDTSDIEDSYYLEDENVSQKRSDLESKEVLEMAMSKLIPEYRAVITLRLIEGYSTRETAEILEVPEGTVLSRMARAQKKLKEEVSKIDNLLWKGN